MYNNNLDAVVLYSANDYRFFKPCIQNLLDSGMRVHVVTYTHMFGGHAENIDLLDKSEQIFQKNKNYKQYLIPWHAGKSPWYWEGYGRHFATQQILNDSSYILYIDIDEIIESKKFKTWLSTEEYKNYDALRLANYWYWREPIYRANKLEDSAVFIKTAIAKALPLRERGRDFYFNSTANRANFVNNQDPLVHHYSWVRTEEEMLNKVSNWGHSSDKPNWKDLVKEEFSRGFNGTDFVHNYSYTQVENIFNI